MMRSAAVTVRRPGASREPATRTRTWRQLAVVKEDANGRIHAASTSGTLAGMTHAFLCAVPPQWLMSKEVVTMAGTDAMHERIAAHPWPRGGVEVIRANRGDTLYGRRTGDQVARLRPTGENDDVQILWWRGAGWATPGDFGPLIMPLNEALNFVATESFFWIGAYPSKRHEMCKLKLRRSVAHQPAAGMDPPLADRQNGLMRPRESRPDALQSVTVLEALEVLAARTGEPVCRS